MIVHGLRGKTLSDKPKKVQLPYQRITDTILPLEKHAGLSRFKFFRYYGVNTVSNVNPLILMPDI